jgi:FkbH-like protein
MVPEEIAHLPDLMKERDFFDLAEITDEDRKRTEMIAAEQAREQVRETLSEADFRAALGLEIDIFRAEKQHLARVAQLINKTNQFNLTTLRRTQDEVEALARSPAHIVLGMELRDKYGEYGLVGVAVLEKQGKTCLIDTLLMSCRVLGRNAEDTFIAGLAEGARALGCDTLRGSYIPTAKNAMVKDLYKNMGFTMEADAWRIAAADVAAIPLHIKARLRLVAEDA